jgi:hypothetical protein
VKVGTLLSDIVIREVLSLRYVPSLPAKLD